MKTFNQLITELQTQVSEILPWDLVEKIASDTPPILLDVREENEFQMLHIKNSIFAPRGILEQACEWNFDVTLPVLVKARDKEVVVICRSGSRSLFAANTLQQLGFNDVLSLKTGIRGWNDYDQPLIDSNNNEVDADEADDFLSNKVTADQLEPVNNSLKK